VSRSRRPSDHARVCRTETHIQQPTTPHNQGSQALMMRKPVSFYRPPVGRQGTCSSSTYFFLGSNKTTGLMVTQHDIRFLVALGTLVVAYWLIFSFSLVYRCSHACPHRRVFLEYPPIPTVAFLPIFLALYLPRRTLSIPTTSHIH